MRFVAEIFRLGFSDVSSLMWKILLWILTSNDEISSFFRNFSTFKKKARFFSSREKNAKSERVEIELNLVLIKMSLSEKKNFHIKTWNCQMDPHTEKFEHKISSE